MISVYSLVGTILVSSLRFVVSRPQVGGFPVIPPPLKAVLPAETIAQIKSIHEDQSVGFHEKQEKIDKIMVNLPLVILDRIPLPPGFKTLPQEVQATIKSINRNKDKPWAAKQVKLQQYVQSLPTEQKNSLLGLANQG